MALYSDIEGSAMGPDGFSPSSQGTREGCTLRPLLFLIIFVDAMRVLERVELDEGAIMLGALSLVIVFLPMTLSYSPALFQICRCC